MIVINREPDPGYAGEGTGQSAYFAHSDPALIFTLQVSSQTEEAVARENPTQPAYRQHARTTLRIMLITASLIFLWWLLVALFSPPPFILPGPAQVATALFSQFSYLLENGAITLLEIILGLLAGTVLGIATALLAIKFPLAGRMILPVVSASQALPVFAIAPLLVIWFGLGLGSKIAMATLIIYFPVASSLIDGLERTGHGLVDLGRLYGASQSQLLYLIRLPAALPSLASGLKVAATIAPIGAIVGEWVGSSRGLGFVILQGNARMQTDMVFAALFVLAIIAISVRALVSHLLDHFIHWTPKTTNPADY